MKNYQGLSSTNANAKFLVGNAVFVSYYSGLVATNQPNLQDFGYLQLPQPANSNGIAATVALATSLAIGINSKHKNASAILSNLLMSKQAARISAGRDCLTLLHDATVPQNEMQIFDEATASEKAEADCGSFPYFAQVYPALMALVFSVGARGDLR